MWQERPGQFSMTLVGIMADPEPAPWLTHLMPPDDCRLYPRFVEWLRSLPPFDIGVAPLVDTPFNRVKSDIKLLDYSALGLASLVSDSPAYRADPAFQSAIVGDWADALRQVIDDPESMRERARAASAHLWLNRTTPHTATMMLDRIEALLAERSEQQRQAAE